MEGDPDEEEELMRRRDSRHLSPQLSQATGVSRQGFREGLSAVSIQSDPDWSELEGGFAHLDVVCVPLTTSPPSSSTVQPRECTHSEHVRRRTSTRRNRSTLQCVPPRPPLPPRPCSPSPPLPPGAIQQRKASGPTPPPYRGSSRGRGRGRGRGAPTVIHRNATWVAPGLPGASTSTPASTSAAPSEPATRTVTPVGGFRNQTLVLNKPAGTGDSAPPSAPSSAAPSRRTSPAPAADAPPRPATPPPPREVVIDGVVFVADQRGNKLVRKPGAPPSLPLLCLPEAPLLSVPCPHLSRRRPCHRRLRLALLALRLDPQAHFAPGHDLCPHKGGQPRLARVRPQAQGARRRQEGEERRDARQGRETRQACWGRQGRAGGENRGEGRSRQGARSRVRRFSQFGHASAVADHRPVCRPVDVVLQRFLQRAPGQAQVGQAVPFLPANR